LKRKYPTHLAGENTKGVSKDTTICAHPTTMTRSKAFSSIELTNKGNCPPLKPGQRVALRRKTDKNLTKQGQILERTTKQTTGKKKERHFRRRGE
jgi:hypothetical protein